MSIPAALGGHSAALLRTLGGGLKGGAHERARRRGVKARDPGVEDAVHGVPEHAPDAPQAFFGELLDSSSSSSSSSSLIIIVIIVIIVIIASFASRPLRGKEEDVPRDLGPVALLVGWTAHPLSLVGAVLLYMDGRVGAWVDPPGLLLENWLTRNLVLFI
jgi:hypothetical protein